jgi:hypothetical protein
MLGTLALTLTHQVALGQGLEWTSFAASTRASVCLKKLCEMLSSQPGIRDLLMHKIELETGR